MSSTAMPTAPCAVVQWRLHAPGPAEAVTGLKRDIALLHRVAAMAGDEVDVFDISMQRNRRDLMCLLDHGVRVRYFDHHAAGDMPAHPGLDATSTNRATFAPACWWTGILDGAHRAWALVGIYGDNLAAVADRLARDAGFEPGDCAKLRRLGELVNYNAYGEEERDLCIPPRSLLALMTRHADPRDMLAHEPVVARIDAMRRSDLRQAVGEPAYWRGPQGQRACAARCAWSRRVITLPRERPGEPGARPAHAVLRERGDGYVVSVRAPLTQPFGAHTLCSGFGGAGRSRAAGIDRLPRSELPRFVEAFANASWA